MIVDLTPEEISATIEAFNVADIVVEGRPPLKNSSPLEKFASPGGSFRRVNGAGTTAWRKFIEAEKKL